MIKNKLFKTKEKRRENYISRLQNLATLIYNLAKNNNVKIINIQELTSRFVSLETIRITIISKLLELSDYWTTTSFAPRQNITDKSECLSLLTIFDSSMLHLVKSTNVNLNSVDYEIISNDLKEAGLKYSNCLVSEFLISDNKKYVNVNIHQTWKDNQKIVSLKLLLEYLTRFDHEKSFVTLNGDFNIGYVLNSDIMKLINEKYDTTSLNFDVNRNVYWYPNFDKTKEISNTFIGSEWKDKTSRPDSWFNGNYDEILRDTKKRIQPIDLFLFSRNCGWISDLEINSFVITHHDFDKFGLQLLDSLRDIEHYLTDHYPVVTNLQFDIV
jgi:hypothetical protein